MAKRGTTRAMSDKHEQDLVEALGGRQTRGSGNQAANPMDGRHSRYEETVALAWDGKSTLGDSITVSRSKEWAKAIEQAHGERPMLALRWYDTDRLDVGLDLALIPLEDLQELLERSRRLDVVERRQTAEGLAELLSEAGG